MQEISMPDVKLGATLGQIYDWLYNGGSYGKNPSVGDMFEKGWEDLVKNQFVRYDPTNKDVRPGIDSAGAYDLYSANMYAELGFNKRYIQNDSMAVGRLFDISGSPNTAGYNVKCALINQLLGAGGTLAATEVIPLAAGKKIFPDEIKVELNPATANISAVGGNSAEITFDNSGGTTLAVGVVSHTKQETYIRLNGSPTSGENVRMTVAAGIAGNVGASRIRGYILYREV